MQIQCRSCGRDIAAADISLERLVAKCAHCDAVFAFSVPAADGGGGAARERKRAALPPIAQPRDFVVEEQGRDLVIVKSWRSGCAIAFMIFFAATWSGITWTGFVMMSMTDAGFFRWFLIPFLLIGVLIVYGVVTLLVNSTTIRAAQGMLSIRHGPLPMPGNVDLPVRDVRQLFVQRQFSSSRSSSGRTSVHERFVLQARLEDGEKRKLLDCRDIDAALWLEHAIERHLGIVDRPERGEV